jgi:hypothetical protein
MGWWSSELLHHAVVFRPHTKCSGETYCLHLQSAVKRVWKWMVNMQMGEESSKGDCLIRTMEWKREMESYFQGKR